MVALRRIQGSHDRWLLPSRRGLDGRSACASPKPAPSSPYGAPDRGPPVADYLPANAETRCESLTMNTHTVRLHRVLRASPERALSRFLDPAALCKWMPPDRLHRNHRSHRCQGGGQLPDGLHQLYDGNDRCAWAERYYSSLIPNEKLVYTDKVDDPNLPGVITVSDPARRGLLRQRSRTLARKAVPGVIRRRSLLYGLARIP